MNGLSLEQAKVSLEQYENRFTWEMKHKTEFVGSVIGVTAGVAAEIFCFVSVITIKDPDAQPGRALPWALGLAFGGLGAGFAAFGLICLAGWILTSRKVNAIQKYRLGLDKFYNNANAMLENGSIAPLMKLVDTEAAQELIGPMNFSQLFAARRALGNIKFAELVGGVKQFAHGLWKQILEAPTAPEALQKYLSSGNVKKLQIKNPEMWAGLRDVAGKIVDEHLFPGLETESQSSETIAIKIGEKTIALNKELLAKNCPYFKDQQAADLTEDAQALNVDIVPLLEMLAGKKRGYSPDLIPFASRFKVEKMESVLDTLLTLNTFDMSLDERCAIVSNYPGYPKLREHLIQTLLNRALTEENLDEMCGFAAKLNSPEIKEKLQAYSLEQLNKALKDNPMNYKVWLDRAFSVELTCGQIHQKLTGLNATNFRAQFEIAKEFKSKGYSQLERDCLNYCQQFPAEIKAHLPWKIEEMPKEVADVIFN